MKVFNATYLERQTARGFGLKAKGAQNRTAIKSLREEITTPALRGLEARTNRREGVRVIASA